MKTITLKGADGELHHFVCHPDRADVWLGVSSLPLPDQADEVRKLFVGDGTTRPVYVTRGYLLSWADHFEMAVVEVES